MKTTWRKLRLESLEKRIRNNG
ncbi:MAG: hypothetical protein AB8F94_20010 [Saprospiraceae bacterium]